jgi:hypothetical protein
MPVNQRSLLFLPATVLAAVVVAAPALAGTDGDEGGGPVTTPAPVPFVQPPAPAPIAAPAPEAPPSTAPTVDAKPKERAKRAPQRRATKRKVQQRPARTVAARRVAAAGARDNTQVPRGGVQAGAGGTARDVRG